jgi:hypothetical protein
MSEHRSPQADSPGLLALGMFFGALLGFIVWMSTGTLAFLPVFIGGGLVVGYAASEARRTRR